MTAPHFWISTGEISGDMHGAALLRELKALCPHLQASGLGGDELALAGQKNVFHIRDLSVMGFTEVLGALPRIIRMLRAIRAELAAGGIDAVVLVDAPSFNFRVGAMAKKLGIPVYYHIPPKLWASRPGRLAALQDFSRKLLCIFPFEERFYREHGLGPDKAVFIGNPLVDLIESHHLQDIPVHANRIGLMPGSRISEIRRLMPQFGKAAKLLQAKRPELEFICMQAPGADAAMLQNLWQQGAGSDIALTLHPAATRYESMKSCQLLLQASGTATLEAALIGTPAVIAYQVSKLSELVMKPFIKVPYIGLPNLIMGREIFPECLQEQADGAILAQKLEEWLEQPAALNRVRADLATLQQLCGPSGSANRAAQLILEDLQPLLLHHPV